MEGFAAGAGILGVRVVDREALTFDGVGKVDRRSAQVGNAHAINDDLDAVEGTHGVPVEAPIVEVELVDQAGATARLDGDAQAQVVAPLLFEEALDLRSSDVGEGNLVGGGLSC